MINLKNLKSIFVVEEEKPANENTDSPTKDAPPTNDNTPPPLNKKPITTIDPTGGLNKKPTTEVSSNNTVTMTNGGTVDKRVFEKLMQVIEANNVEGFDYLEFKNSLKALANIPIDEATKFQSAFATASTMGLTHDKLVQSINYYKGLLDKEAKTFSDQARQMTQERVVAKEKERAALDKAIQDKKAQLERLQQEITQHQQKISSIELEANDLRSKIAETQNNFQATYQHLVKLFTTDLEKVDRYLPKG